MFLRSDPRKPLDNRLGAAGDRSSSPEPDLLIAISEQAHGTIMPATVGEEPLTHSPQVRRRSAQEQPALPRAILLGNALQGRRSVLDRIGGDRIDEHGPPKDIADKRLHLRQGSHAAATLFVR